MASIKPVKDKNGNLTGYRVRSCLGRDEQYKQVFRTTTIKRPEGLTPAKERKEVERLADAWEQTQKAEYDRTHEKHDKTQIPFDAFIREHWIPDHVQDGTHTPSSVSFFKHMSDELIEYFGRKKLTSIDAETVKRWIKHLNTEAKTKSGNPLSATTIQHQFSTLRNVMRYAARFGYIQQDPTANLAQREKPHRPKREISFLDAEHARRFMSCLAEEPLYLRCLLSVMIQTGLRRGETVGLQWGDIDHKTLMLNVERNITLDTASPDKIHVGDTKTGENRIVPITSSLYSMLMQLKEEQEERYGVLFPNAYIFCAVTDPFRPLYPTTPTRMVDKFIKKYNLPNVSPHDLRHTAATLALEAGANLKQVQTLLGHKDASTTMQFYAGVSEAAQRQTVEGIETLLKTNAAK